MGQRILVLCTGNSARSQMAEGLLKSFDPGLDVYSAGIKPAGRVHPGAVRVMAEIGIDISGNRPKQVDKFLGQSFDFVITVCDHANEACPVFTGRVGRRVHVGFEDPAAESGTDEKILSEFRRVRDQIRHRLHEFYLEEVQPGAASAARSQSKRNPIE